MMNMYFFVNGIWVLLWVGNEFMYFIILLFVSLVNEGRNFVWIV